MAFYFLFACLREGALGSRSGYKPHLLFVAVLGGKPMASRFRSRRIDEIMSGNSGVMLSSTMKSLVLARWTGPTDSLPECLGCERCSAVIPIPPYPDSGRAC